MANIETDSGYIYTYMCVHSTLSIDAIVGLLLALKNDRFCVAVNDVACCSQDASRAELIAANTAALGHARRLDTLATVYWAMLADSNLRHYWAAS